MFYKRHTITRSNSYHAASGRPLYGIDGRFGKAAGTRPFVTSFAEAKEWISGQLEMAEYCTSQPLEPCWHCQGEGGWESHYCVDGSTWAQCPECGGSGYLEA